MWTDEQIETALRQLPTIPSEYRDRQAAVIAGQLLPLIRHLTRGICLSNADRAMTQRDDLQHDIAIAIIGHLRAYARGEDHQGVKSFLPYLNRLIQREGGRLYESEPYRPAGATVADVRRRKRVAHHEVLLRSQLNREPSDEELVEFMNAQVRASQARPEKHGSLVSVAQVRAFRSN